MEAHAIGHELPRLHGGQVEDDSVRVINLERHELSLMDAFNGQVITTCFLVVFVGI